MMDTNDVKNKGWTINPIFTVLALLFILLINGCSTTSRKDGPPPFYVDETKIPNAVPRVEPLSRIGNKPSYSVFGRRYHVMKTSRNYHEKGIASWYGTKFHSHHTSNGERYNMLAMTAAHKSLPLPTYIQVTNLKNGKKVIVKVNDRGPFEANRIIDLSYVAAKKLGMIGHGTAYVDVKSIDPRDAYRHRALFAKNKRQYQYREQPVYIQVGAFKNRLHAENVRRHLLAVVSSPIRVTHPNKLYKVQIGPIRNVAAASVINKKLKTIGVRGKEFKAEV